MSAWSTASVPRRSNQSSSRLVERQRGGVDRRADTAGLRYLVHRLRQAVTQIHTRCRRTIVPEQRSESKPRLRVEITLDATLHLCGRRGGGPQIVHLSIAGRGPGSLRAPSVTRGGAVCPRSQHRQPSRCRSDRPADVQIVARPGAAARQHLTSFDRADDRDVDDQRAVDPGQVAARNGDPGSRRQRDQARR